MEKLVSYLGTVSLQSVIVVILTLVCITGIVCWVCKAVAKNREKEQKNNASDLGLEQLDELFKIRKIDEDKEVALLSANPTMEYYSGTGDPTWFKLNNIPKYLRREGVVVKVEKDPDGNLKIVSVQLHRLPTEIETEARKAVKAAADAEAAVKALEVQKVT